MQAMLARVTDPGSYQAFHHFITHAPWDSAAVWHRLLAVLPERRGLLILDDTPFLKQGTHSVGVARQYASTVKKVTNCQVAVTAALWSGVRAWLVGAELYLPAEWLTSARRTEARIPTTVRFQEKWRLALTLVRRVRAAGLTIEAVLADAGYGIGRGVAHRARPPAVGLCRRHRVGCDCLRGHAAGESTAPVGSPGAPAAISSTGGQPAPLERRRADCPPARLAVASHLVAQRHQPPVARRVCGPPRHAGRRLARAPHPGVRLVTGRTRRR